MSPVKVDAVSPKRGFFAQMAVDSQMKKVDKAAAGGDWETVKKIGSSTKYHEVEMHAMELADAAGRTDISSAITLAQVEHFRS